MHDGGHPRIVGMRSARRPSIEHVDISRLRHWAFSAVIAVAAPSLGCDGLARRHPDAAALQTWKAAASPDVDREAAVCAARWKEIEASPKTSGAKAYDADRIGFLGRARGEPVVFVDEPLPATPDADATLQKAWFDAQPAGLRVARLRERLKGKPAILRSLLLREGYAYLDDPRDMFFFVEKIELADLFDAPTLYLERGETRFKLSRTTLAKKPAYVVAEGETKGRKAQLLFADRVSDRETDLNAPKHVDVRTAFDREGIDRFTIERLTESGMIGQARFGSTWARAVITRRGAHAELACLDEPREKREAIARHVKDTAWRRLAVQRLRAAVGDELHEALPFDRPRGFEGPDRDGELRPYWMSAYLSGRQAFEVDGSTYYVYREDGKPQPPQVCVDFVLDSFERASGSWFNPRGEKPGRTKGVLSFDDFKIENRRGVVGFGLFVESRADLFDLRRFTGKERIPFGQRDEYFAALKENADEFAAGDIVAIQGLKRDDRVHQHAILVEGTDPLTGFPYALADQMKLPRRRTWEGIMAEAPKRSLYYRARPLRVILEKLSAPRD